MYNVNDINTELYVHHQHHGHHHQLGILESEASLIILFHLVLSCAAQLMSLSARSLCGLPTLLFHSIITKSNNLIFPLQTILHIYPNVSSISLPGVDFSMLHCMLAEV